MQGDAPQSVVSILLVGDSHVAGYRKVSCEVTREGTARVVVAHVMPVHIFGAYSALDATVTFPDGRVGLNPLLQDTLGKNWLGVDVKGNPVVPGTKVQKHVVLSLGTSFSANDPMITYADRSAYRIFFPHGFDFVLPSRPDLPIDPTCTILPVAVVRDLYAGILAPLREALTILVSEYGKSVWVVGSPPPSDNNQARQKLVKRIAQRFSSPEAVLPSPAVALKLWLLVTDYVRSMCAECGCVFLDCTQVACNEAGFLRSEFEFDGFHANAAYCERMTHLMVSQIGATAFA